MVGGSADTLQLCTLPLELLPLLCTASAMISYSVLYFLFFCVIVTVSLVFVSPYKQQYQKYNKPDFIMFLSLGIVIDAYLFHFTYIYLEHPYSHIAYIVSLIFSLSPLVYFTVRVCLSMKRVLVQKLSIGHHASCSGQREDYEDLNSITSAN